jgi:hypothetical protein
LLPGEYSQRQAEFLNAEKQNSDRGLGFSRTTKCIVQAIHSIYLDNCITLRVIEPKDEKIVITERTVTIDLIKEKLEFVMSDADLTQTVKIFTDDPSKKVDLMSMRYVYILILIYVYILMYILINM